MNKANLYSAQAIYGVLSSLDGMCNKYTRRDDLRYQMASLGKDAIKNELLKNVSTVAAYHLMRGTKAGLELGDRFSAHMDFDQRAVVLCNNITRHGVKKGYELLEDPDLLFSACFCFAKYRSPGMKERMDDIAKTNNGVMYIHNDLDTYYARYGDRPKAIVGEPFRDNIGMGRK